MRFIQTCLDSIVEGTICRLLHDVNLILIYSYTVVETMKGLSNVGTHSSSFAWPPYFFKSVLIILTAP